MNYFRYIFSDKNAATYWIGILLVLIIYTLPSILVRYNQIESTINNYIWNFTTIIIYIAIFIGFYTSGYINYRIQQNFKATYKDKIENKTNISVQVEIYQESFKITPLKQNHEAKINIKPRLDTFNLCKVGDNLILLGQVYDLGIFRRHLKPILISLNPASFSGILGVLKPRFHELESTESGLFIIFDESVCGIKKLLIKDYKY